ncbi:MAG TPA: S9 family peptidase [Gemmatimonadaceae bacterium]|nr:S9 family peptidase [Gemmatimonadaceae bacterium]
MTRSHARLVAALTFVAFALPLPSQQPAPRRGVTAEDYYAFVFASDPRLSPDGRLVAYVSSRIDRAKNRRLPSLWVVPADGSGAPRRIVDEAWSPSAPRWSPDGRTIAFTSRGAAPDSSGSTAAPAAPAAGAPAAAAPARAQLWTVAVDGGAPPRRVTSAANGVANCAWSPDGAHVACLVKTGPSDSLNKGPERSDVRHYAHAGVYFNDTGWFDDKRSHVWIFDASGTGAAGRQITSGDAWNDTDPQWSPDGSRIAFVSDRSGKEYDEGWTSDVWTVPVAGGALTRVSVVTAHNDAPRWSPDGRTIAFLSSPSDNDPPTLMLAPSDGRAAPRVASKALDLIPVALQWGDGGRALYFETGVRGENQIYRVDVPSGAVRPVTGGPRGVRAPNVVGARMAYLANDFKHLDDVYTADANGQHERKLTDLNAELWKGLDLASVERMTYKGADGWNVDGFLVRPVGWTAGKKYPLILSVHGGPAGQYGVDWYHEFQVYAAKGYAVFFANPRGSTGYGRAFQRGIMNQWGGNDYVDVMNGVRAVIARNPWIDTARLGVTGGSYGGFMTNWIVGHTGMFKAAVTLRSVVNFVSDEGTRDGAYGHKEDFGGDLFEKFDLYWDRSPLKYAKNVTTPVLVLHSENDFRVPLEQGLQWFRALRHYDKTAELVIFPRENHNLTRTGEPRHLVESLNWQQYWFDKYLDGNEAAVPPDRR